MISKIKEDEGGLLPYVVILAATKGDSQAMQEVVQHFERYIAYLSVRKIYDANGDTHYDVDVDKSDRMRSKLMRAILGFQV